LRGPTKGCTVRSASRSYAGNKFISLLPEVVEPFSQLHRLIGMGTAATAYSDYRTAFAEFADKVRQSRALVAAAKPDWQAIDAALLEVEKARANYEHRRNTLAKELLNSPDAAPDGVQPFSSRVSEIAELRWELAGKPEGTADENWYRAEDIVRRAMAA